MAIDPVTAAALIGAGGGFLKSIGGGIAGRGKEKRAAKEAQKERDFQRERDVRGVAAEESMADPFRHSLAQMNAAAAFDQMQNTRPKTISLPGLNPKYMPKLGGGYQPSQELRDAAGAARTSVLAGQGQAPTMTDPTNYGKTGALNIIALLMKQGLLDPNDPRLAGIAQIAGGGARDGSVNAYLPGSGGPSQALRAQAMPGRLPLDESSVGAYY